MINPSFQELEKISKSRYEIAMMAAKRAKEIIGGDKPLIKSKGAKPVTIALNEIMAEKIKKVDESTMEVNIYENEDFESEEK